MSTAQLFQCHYRKASYKDRGLNINEECSAIKKQPFSVPNISYHYIFVSLFRPTRH